jgi:hypothetical protein
MLSNATELDKKNATNHAKRRWLKAIRNFVTPELVRDPEYAIRSDFSSACGGRLDVGNRPGLFSRRVDKHHSTELYSSGRPRGAHGKKDVQSHRRRSGKQVSPSELIDAKITELGDWRGEMLARVRKVIKQAVPDVVEEWKWRGVPVWEYAGIICTGETYKAVVKMTFAKGASLDDPSGLFNSSLDGNTRRAIDIHEGDKLDEKALKALIRAAVALNTSTKKKPKKA